MAQYNRNYLPRNVSHCREIKATYNAPKAGLVASSEDSDTTHLQKTISRSLHTCGKRNRSQFNKRSLSKTHSAEAPEERLWQSIFAGREAKRRHRKVLWGPALGGKSHANRRGRDKPLQNARPWNTGAEYVPFPSQPLQAQSRTHLVTWLAALLIS